MSLESRDTGSRRPATGDTHADRAAPRLAGEPGPECRMKWMKTEDPEFRVPVPAPEAFGGWPFYFLVHRTSDLLLLLHSRSSTFARGWNWNLEFGNPGTTVPTLGRDRNSKIPRGWVCFQVPSPFLEFGNSAAGVPLGTGGRGWDSNVEPREGMGFPVPKFREWDCCSPTALSLHDDGVSKYIGHKNVEVSRCGGVEVHVAF